MIAVQGYIYASYAITFGSIGLFAWWVLRRGRALAHRLPDEDKPWI
jgi:heme exporter protein CcmD